MACPFSCSDSIDYITVQTGERILPFRFTLDRAESVLEPEEGQLQRFVYLIDADGEEGSQFADLSHFVLGICPEITLSDLSDVTVVVDGVPQTVALGENVDIFTAEKPDPSTGFAGLKFGFGLDKTNGQMQVAFSLAKTYPVRNVTVGVKGGQTTLDDLSICGPSCCSGGQCSTVAYQNSTICVPITVTAYATCGTVTTNCCGEPTVTTGDTCAQRRAAVSGTFTIQQPVCFSIPVNIEATAVAGDSVATPTGAGVAGCDCSQPVIR